MEKNIINSEIRFVVGEDELFYLIDNKVIGITLGFKSHSHFITEGNIFYLKVEDCNIFNEYPLEREVYLKLKDKENEIIIMIDEYFKGIDNITIFSLNNDKNYLLEDHLSLELKQYKNFLNCNHKTLADNENSYSGNWIEEYIMQKEREWVNKNKHNFHKQEEIYVEMGSIKILKSIYHFNKGR